MSERVATLLSTEFFQLPTKLYRVGRMTTGDYKGLWYDDDGQYTGDIHKLEGAAAAALPMGRHPIFTDAGTKWVSTTDQLSTLAMWFSASDMRQLYPQGYRIMEIDVPSYRRLHFDGYSHEVFDIGQMIGWNEIDPSKLYPNWRLH